MPVSARESAKYLATFAMCAATACGPSSPPQRPTALELGGPPSAAPPPEADPEPHALGKVDLDSLTNRERRAWWRFVTTLYAPCPAVPVSVAQCVDQRRPCAACAPAAELIAEKIKEGATSDQMQTLYAERFGPNVKTADVTGSPFKGPENAKVVILEWFDFECPHCRLALPILDELQKRHDKDVKLVKKFYPLQMHTHAEGAARAAIAAMDQGKYWEMEALLFKHQDKLEEQDLDSYATELRLDLGRFHADEKSEATTAMLKRDHDEAERDGLSGTPFILIDGHEFDLTYFHLDVDLEPWVATEIAMKK